MLGKLVFVVVLSLLSSEIVSATTTNVVCYHGTWAKYRNGNGAFSISNIDTSLCTHIIYSFIGISADGTVKTLDSWLDFDLNNLNSFTALKSSNSKVKTLVAMGGWNEGSLKYSNVAASASLRAVFIQSALEFVQKYNFDGFDFDWEYPAQRGGAAADVVNFVTLLKEFKAVFEQNGLLVTAAVAAAETSVSLSYDVAGLSQYLDMINVMTYDLHVAGEGVTGHNAPLYASSKDTTAASLQLNVDACISNWLNKGANPDKLNLGIPLYGRTFTLSDASNVALGAPSAEAGIAGPYTLEAGYLGYNEIVEKQLAGGWTYVWDAEQQVPHMYNGNQWVGFDDPASVKLKVQYAQSRNLGGVILWSIETDDFHGLSGVKNPLQKAIQEQLGSSSSADSSDNTTTKTTTTATTTTAATTKAATTKAATTKAATTKAATTKAATTKAATTKAATTKAATTKAPSANSNAICSSTGYVRDSTDCGIYYYCSAASATPIKMACSANLYYDTSTGICNWAALTDCS